MPDLHHKYPLIKLIEKGDTKKAKALLHAGANSAICHALNRAAHHDQVEIARFILNPKAALTASQKAQLLMAEVEGRTPLMEAAARGNLQLLELLINEGALDKDFIKNLDAKKPTLEAFKGGWKYAMAYLIAHGADSDVEYPFTNINGVTTDPKTNAVLFNPRPKKQEEPQKDSPSSSEACSASIALTVPQAEGTHSSKLGDTPVHLAIDWLYAIEVNILTLDEQLKTLRTQLNTINASLATEKGKEKSNSH